MLVTAVAGGVGHLAVQLAKALGVGRIDRSSRIADQGGLRDVWSQPSAALVLYACDAR